MTKDEGFHTLINFMLASRDGTGWTMDWIDDAGMRQMIMGGSAREVIEKTIARISPVEPTAKCAHDWQFVKSGGAMEVAGFGSNYWSLWRCSGCGIESRRTEEALVIPSGSAENRPAEGSK